MMINQKSNKTFATVIFVATTIFSTQSLAGDKIFNEVCSDCHTGGFKGWISGAPNVNKKTEWGAFLENNALNEMIKIVTKGTKDHKKKGGCKKCSNEEIADAVNYIMTLVK